MAKKKKEYWDKQTNTHFVASVNPNYFCVFPMVEYNGMSAAHRANEINLQKNNTGGLISFKGAKRLNKSIAWFVAASTKKYVTKGGRIVDWCNIQFITLTLSGTQKHDDNFIKANMLNPFIDLMREQHKVYNYIWRAEAQANGNIHFHIIIDKMIYWKWVRRTWNHIQQKFGYMDEYHEKFFGIPFFQYWDIMKSYFIKKYGLKEAQGKAAEVYAEQKKEGWRNPNSTDIHKAHKAKSVSGYLSKYISKTSAGLASCVRYEQTAAGPKVVQERYNSSCNTNGCTRVIFGRQWYLSANLQNMKNIQIEMGSDAGSCLRSLIGGIATYIEMPKVEGKFTPDLYRCDFLPYLSKLPLLKDYFEEKFLKINTDGRV